MSWDLVLRHCAVIRAGLDQTRVSLELQSVQLAGLEAFATAHVDQQAARQALPDRCQGIADGDCGLRSEDAQIAQGSLSHPRKWVCKGCQVISMDGVTT